MGPSWGRRLDEWRRTSDRQLGDSIDAADAKGSWASHPRGEHYRGECAPDPAKQYVLTNTPDCRQKGADSNEDAHRSQSDEKGSASVDPRVVAQTEAQQC
jgi:hypothetical protein